VSKGRVRTYDELLARYAIERSDVEREPVRLGFGSIDADLRGVSPGQVLGFAARSGTGKTWFLGTVADAFAARTDAGCLVLSLEQPGPEWVERSLAIHADVSPEQVEEAARERRLGDLAGGFLERMRNARVVDEPLTLDDVPAALQEARDSLQVPLRLVLVDYLGLLRTAGTDAYQRASALGVGLKALAKSEDVPIVVAVQLSRAGGDGSQPVSMDMLRDSGVLEESLDFLLGAWRPGKQKDLPLPDAISLRDVLRVAVLKNRKGPDGRQVDLHFRPDSRRLYEEADPFSSELV